jgi:tocopherol O-methyltransferase
VRAYAASGEIMRSDPSSTGAIDPTLADVRAYYDETWLDYRVLWLRRRTPGIHFGYWDEQTRRHADALLNLNRVLAARIGIQPGQRILDAGCGVGGSAIWLAETYDVEVVGITPVASQVARARRYAAERGLGDRVSFSQQDYQDTSFPAASFDVVWAMESACHAADKRRFLAEARRVLKPGGHLGLVEYMRTAPHFAPEDEALLQSWLSGWAIPHLATQAQWEEWAGEAGFDEVDVGDITANVRRSLRRLYRMAVVAWPVELLLHGAGLRSAFQHGNVRGARDQYRALLRGLWFDAVMTATAGSS